MSNKFGFLINLQFLQNWASIIISKINPAVIHNIEKYHIIKKVHYLSSIENLEGDYLEFGIFQGSSFCHSIRCCRALEEINKNVLNTKFYGFDSFEGFGSLSDNDVHPFYTDETFETSFEMVNKRVKKVAKNIKFKLIPGFFSDSLKNGPSKMGIIKSRIIFIDSDTYSSTEEALDFCLSTIQMGTYIILDDYFSYKGDEKKGVAGAFRNFINKSSIKVRQVFIYGNGGAVFIVSGID